MATCETCFSDSVFNRSPLVKSVHWVHLLGFGGFGGVFLMVYSVDPLSVKSVHWVHLLGFGGFGGVFFAEIVLEGMSSTGSSLGISLK